MSWTLIICESARSYSTEMEIFPDQDVPSEIYSVPEGGYYFQYCLNLMPQDPKVNKAKSGKPQTGVKKKLPQEGPRVSFRKEKTKSRGKVNLDMKKKRGKKS